MLKCMKWILKKVKKLYAVHKKKMKLRRLDEMWREFGGNCFGMIPPSFYLTHTPEEINRRTKAEIDKLKELIDQYCKSIEMESNKNSTQYL